MDLASLVVNVQGEDTAIITYGNLIDPAHIKATAYYGLAFAPVAVVMGFSDKGCNYLIAQRAPAVMATSEAEDGTLSLQIQHTSQLNMQRILEDLHEAEEGSRWELSDGMLWGTDSEVTLASLLRLLDCSAVTL